jgi:cell division protein FtsW
MGPTRHVFVLSLIGFFNVNGAKRWISFASFGLQPSELAKVGIIFFLARLLTVKVQEMHRFAQGFIGSLLIALFTFALILKQPNYSTAATVLAISIAMVFIGGCRISHLFISAGAGIPALIGLMISSPYRQQRVEAFLNPELNPQSSYQSLQSLISLGNGGFFGTGLGTSTQKLGFLPMPFTDTIFAVLGEELGYLGTSICLLLFAMVIWRGLRTAFWCPDRFGSLVALGATVSIAVNVIMHVGVCAKFFPTTGQPLPFVSYGGTSLCTALFLMGVLLNISQHAAQGEPPAWMKDPAKVRLLNGTGPKPRKTYAAPALLPRRAR